MLLNRSFAAMAVTAAVVLLAPRVARADGGYLGVYLVDETDPLVFLMYDDRGAILHAPVAARLRPLYDLFDDWLVDHDRPEIDAQFASTT